MRVWFEPSVWLASRLMLLMLRAVLQAMAPPAFFTCSATRLPMASRVKLPDSKRLLRQPVRRWAVS